MLTLILKIASRKQCKILRKPWLIKIQISIQLERNYINCFMQEVMQNKNRIIKNMLISLQM